MNIKNWILVILVFSIMVGVTILSIVEMFQEKADEAKTNEIVSPYLILLYDVSCFYFDHDGIPRELDNIQWQKRDEIFAVNFEFNPEKSEFLVENAQCATEYRVDQEKNVNFGLEKKMVSLNSSWRTVIVLVMIKKDGQIYDWERVWQRSQETNKFKLIKDGTTPIKTSR